MGKTKDATGTEKNMGTTALKEEVSTFEKHLPELLKDVGKFALIHDSELSGVYSSYEDAIKIGYEKYGMKPFLVRRIAQTEQVGFVSRMVASCPA